MQYLSQFRKGGLVYSLITELSQNAAVEVAPVNPGNKRTFHVGYMSCLYHT